MKQIDPFFKKFSYNYLEPLADVKQVWYYTHTREKRRDQTHSLPANKMFTMNVVDAVSSPQERVLQRKLHKMLDCDLNMSSLKVVNNSVSLTLNTNVFDKSERKILKTGVRCMVEEALKTLEFAPDTIAISLKTGVTLQDIKVRAGILPYKTLYDVEPISEYIASQLECVNSLIDTSVEAMLRNSLHKTVLALPWRDKDDMKDRIEPLVEETMRGYFKGSQENIVQCVDKLLPCPNDFLSDMDLTFLLKQVVTYVGQPLCSRLHFYETIYRIVLYEPNPLEITCILFDSVFDNLWDDLMLEDL